MLFVVNRPPARVTYWYSRAGGHKNDTSYWATDSAFNNVSIFCTLANQQSLPCSTKVAISAMARPTRLLADLLARLCLYNSQFWRARTWRLYCRGKVTSDTSFGWLFHILMFPRTLAYAVLMWNISFVQRKEAKIQMHIMRPELRENQIILGP